MSVNRLAYFVTWPFLIFIMTTIPTEQMATDSLKIVSRGTENSIIIDSLQIPSDTATTVISKNVKGTITQTGSQNHVEINSAKDTVSGITKSTTTITQTGTNNSVKINSE